MHNYDKKDTDHDYAGKSTKNGKIGEVYDWIQNKLIGFKYNFVLILFYHAATNQLEGNRKISADIHFISFAGMLPVIFFILARHLIFVKPVKNGSYLSK